MVSDWPATLPHRIDQIAADNAEKVALMDGGGETLTYADMSRRIEGIARALLDSGVVRAGSRVLVFQQPSVNWVCSMLAIMRLGAVYVPLDLRNPITRLAAVARDCEATAVLSDYVSLDDAPQLAVGVIIDVTHLSNAASKKDAKEDGNGDEAAAGDNRAEAGSPAAILYTSGSTGTPKGIVVTHAGLRNEIEGYTKTWGLGAECVLQQSAMTFNHSSDQMFTALVNGGCVLVVPAHKRGDPLEIAALITDNAVTYTKATPSEYLMWLQYGRDSLRSATAWRFAFGGGEQLPGSVPDGLASLGLRDLRFHNSYGPTEISISSHKMIIPYTDHGAMLALGRTIPCGFSLPNYHTYIVDEHLRPLPIGMPGEVCIGGAGMSLGYINNPALTAQHFLHNPFATADDIARGWTRMYRTGDVGFLRHDGAMVFQSRMAGDTQVKLRGLRIELRDIESCIVAAASGVLSEAIVTLHDNDLLVAHVAFASQEQQPRQKDDAKAFLDRLLSQLPLPQYMVPVVAVPVDKLPMNNHAKVDRRAVREMALPELNSSNIKLGPEDGLTDEDLTETMSQLALIWRQVLGSQAEQLGLLSGMGPSTNFFLVGGNSLLVLRLQAQIRRVFNTVVPLVRLLGASTLGDMAQVIEESAGNNAKTRPRIDWEFETRPPTIPDFLKGVDVDGKQDKRDEKKTLVFTGATSFTARHLLLRLVASDAVEAIHCVALRTDNVRDVEPLSHLKVHYHPGDLSAELLGLPEPVFRDLASRVDAVVHLGAVRGFFDNYHLLRPANVSPARELVRLAAPRRIPIHFVSTAGVLPRHECTAAAAVSASQYVPAEDGDDGYAASKWASERILERAAGEMGVPSTIYRFVPTPSTIRAADEEAKAVLLAELGRLVVASGQMPDMTGWSGQVDFMPAEDVAGRLEGAILESTAAASGNDNEAGDDSVGSQQQQKQHGARFRHYESPISLRAEELRATLETHNAEGLGRMPLLKWFGRIKAHGFAYLLTSQDTSVDTGGEGQSVIGSRR